MMKNVKRDYCWVLVQFERVCHSRRRVSAAIRLAMAWGTRLNGFHCIAAAATGLKPRCEVQSFKVNQHRLFDVVRGYMASSVSKKVP